MTTPLGPDVLIPVALSAEEAISQPFRIAIDAVSEQRQIDPNTILNYPACVTLTRSDNPTRHFHGIVRRCAAGGSAPRGYWGYTIELAPKFWFLGQTEDCRVYQAMSTVDILKQLLSDAGVTDSAFRIFGGQPVREYTTQYNETDLDFATRLMEEEGYFYYFEHTASEHRLVVTDANVAFQPIAQPQVYAAAPGVGSSHEGLTAWRPALAITYGKVQLTDYDPVAPTKTLDATRPTALKTGGATTRDVYHWAARTDQPALVTLRARLRIEAAEAAAALIEGAGHHEGFTPGGKFTLMKDPFGGADGQDYVVHGVTHQATDQSWLAGGGGMSYANSFTAFPATRTWRQPISVPRPHMGGLYSAVVLGPSGEEIYTEELGRVKVQFRWDHKPDATADKACWVRVVQSWAGGGWGWQYLPRVGSEVAVAFMNGDPDRPVVVGGLYNGTDKPIFPLPDQKTKSGLRTRSSMNGGTADFSEFSIDDKKGSELVFLHAQKDHTIEVENDQKLTVDNCRIKTVKKDETVEIDQNQKIKIGQDQTVEITNARTVKIDQGDDALSLQMGNLSIKLAMGNMSTKAELGAITEEAMQSIQLKVGGNSLTIDQTGVTIKGLMVKVAADVMLDMKGVMSSLKGEAMLIMKGGIVMLN
jgi:type VI secretion system secreted protein VgrG